MRNLYSPDPKPNIFMGPPRNVISSIFIGFYSSRNNYNKENCLVNIFSIEPYYAYTLIAPLYIGFMSVIAVYVSKRFTISIRKAFAIIGIISAIIVSLAITYCNIYTFDRTRLTEQYFRLLLYHFILYVIIIATIYEYINPTGKKNRWRIHHFITFWGDKTNYILKRFYIKIINCFIN